MMIDKEALGNHAIALENAIADHIGMSEDVSLLASYQPLLDAIEGAKKGGIDAPVKLGLSRWEMESNIANVAEVALRLAQFELLLEGWALPSESDSG